MKKPKATKSVDKLRKEYDMGTKKDGVHGKYTKRYEVGSMMKKANANGRFRWSDAWTFAAMAGATNDSSQIDYVKLLAVGDLLNHDIISAKELRQALTILHKHGLVVIVDSNVTTTSRSSKLHNRIRRMRGGLFSMVDNTLKVLNSPTTKLPQLATTPDVSFINSRFIKRAFKEYSAGCHRFGTP
jgi:hypothetical protein